MPRAREARAPGASGCARPWRWAARARAVLPRRARRGRRDATSACARSTISPSCRSPRRTTCASTTRSASSRCRARSWSASTPPRAPGASPPWSATRGGDLDVWREVMARALAAAGAEPGPPHPDRLRLRPLHRRPRLPRRGRAHGAHRGAGVLGQHAPPDAAAPGLPAAGARLHAVVRAAHRREHARAGDATRARSASRYGLFGAEPWTEAMRAQLEALWGCTAVDFYGLSEIIGPGVAGECAEARDGLHVNEDHFLPEIVDPASGAPLPAGQEGELVLTCLTKEALPMIRYRTGDVTSARSRALPLRADHRAHGARQGAHRRHAGHQGRQRLPLAGRGGAARRWRSWPRTTSSWWTARGAFPTLAVHVEPAERVVREWGGFEAGPRRGRGARPRGWRSGCAATSASTRRSPSSRPEDHPAQRGQGGAGRGKEIVMSARARRSAACWPASRRASASSRPTR